MNTDWKLPPPDLREDGEALLELIERCYRAELERSFRDSLSANPALPVETRALRRVDGWQLLLLLTPWMFARLLLPDAPPAAIPAGWSAREREQAEPVVLGPLLEVDVAGAPQKAHLNYHPQLGHYLIQPLVLALDEYRSAEEVYAAWNRVIQTRDENMRRMQRECPMQQEVSRREFFTGLLRRGS
jgi:hypothetical protein